MATSVELNSVTFTPKKHQLNFVFSTFLCVEISKVPKLLLTCTFVPSEPFVLTLWWGCWMFAETCWVRLI